jgi:hypothetical protein
MLARIPLLDASACDAITDAVLAQRELWTRRTPGAEFYTFGAASYLDERSRYDELASARNSVLRDQFAALYDAVAHALERHLAAPVRYAAGKALPGFHVWGVPGIPLGPDASLHFDLQYERLHWPEGRDPVEPLSFTLPVRLPRLGGGLSVWDLTRDRVDAFYARTGFCHGIDELARLTTERFERYTCGEMVVHSGHVLHRIAPIETVEPDDLRVTLQGHGVMSGGRWQLYW